MEKVKVIQQNTGGVGGMVCFLAFVGALVYFVQQATSVWEGVIGVLKVIVWPAFLVYGLLDFLNI